jgi:hypothetical protein
MTDTFIGLKVEVLSEGMDEREVSARLSSHYPEME